MEPGGQNLPLCGHGSHVHTVRSGEAILGQIMIDKAINRAQGILCPVPPQPPPAT